MSKFLNVRRLTQSEIKLLKYCLVQIQWTKLEMPKPKLSATEKIPAEIINSLNEHSKLRDIYIHNVECPETFNLALRALVEITQHMEPCFENCNSRKWWELQQFSFALTRHIIIELLEQGSNLSTGEIFNLIDIDKYGLDMIDRDEYYFVTHNYYRPCGAPDHDDLFMPHMGHSHDGSEEQEDIQMT